MKQIKSVRLIHDVDSTNRPIKLILGEGKAAINIKLRKLFIGDQDGKPEMIAAPLNYDASSFVYPDIATTEGDDTVINIINELYRRSSAEAFSPVTGTIATQAGVPVLLIIKDNAGNPLAVPEVKWKEVTSLSGTLAAGTDRNYPIPLPVQSMSNNESKKTGDVIWSDPYFVPFYISGAKVETYIKPVTNDDGEMTVNRLPGYSFARPRLCCQSDYGSSASIIDVRVRRLIYEEGVHEDDLRPAYDLPPMTVARFNFTASINVTNARIYHELTVY